MKASGYRMKGRPRGGHRVPMFVYPKSKETSECRVCGEEIAFDTDRKGHVVAIDLDGLRHGCEGA